MTTVFSQIELLHKNTLGLTHEYNLKRERERDRQRERERERNLN